MRAAAVLDFSRCPLQPFAHQREDTAWLMTQPYAFIASEMRTGKTKIVIDAAQFLFEADLIDKVIVVAPAAVRDVWFDPDLGEIAKHAWMGTRHGVLEFHGRNREWVLGERETIVGSVTMPRKPLVWVVTNFEFIRLKERLKQLSIACGPKTLLVLDESSFVSNHAAAQTKACIQLRKKCGRVVLLNGTPIFHSPLNLFSQGNLLHRSVLDCQFVTHFKARYAIQQPVKRGDGSQLTAGKRNLAVTSVVGWTNLEDLERRFAPVTVRRMQADCLDLPPKLDPVTLTATLTPKTWQAYKAMRDDMVIWLTESTVATSATAAVKALRLSQITGGFVGGVENAGIELVGSAAARDGIVDTPAPVELGREKLDVLLWFVEQQLEADPNLHLVTWSRFRAEALRAEAEVKKRFPQFETAVIMAQPHAERLRALSLLKPETSPKGPVFVAGVEGTGSFGLDFTAAHTCVTMSSGYSPGRSAQTLDRVYGPGQTQPIAYFDIIAVGPNGQKTIDRDILLSRREGHNVAMRTAAAWIKTLKEE